MWLALVRHTARVLRKHVAKHGVTSDVALASSRLSRDERLACKPNHDNAPMPSDERGCKRVTKSKLSCFAKPQEAVSLSRSAKHRAYQHLRRMTDLLDAVRLGWSIRTKWHSAPVHPTESSPLPWHRSLLNFTRNPSFSVFSVDRHFKFRRSIKSFHLRCHVPTCEFLLPRTHRVTTCCLFILIKSFRLVRVSQTWLWGESIN